MKRRLLAALAAVLSATLGAVLLLGYVSGADRRAMAGMQTTTVLVTTTTVPAGTTGAAMSKLVVVKTLPVAALAPGVVHDLAALQGLVATTELQPGEQVLSARFADPASLADAGRPAVPRGRQQITIDLDPQRVLGGALAPGARVAAFSTIEKHTRLAVRSALVLRVDLAAAAKDDAPPGAPTDGHVRLTLAVTAADARRLVAGADSGTVWFSLVQPAPARAAGAPAPAKSVTS